MDFFCAGQIQKSLIYRQGLNQRRERQHHLFDLFADLLIMPHPGLYDDKISAGLSCLPSRHGRPYTIFSCNVTGCSNNTALATTNNNRLILQVWIIPLFNRTIKRITVDMSHG